MLARKAQARFRPEDIRELAAMGEERSESVETTQQGSFTRVEVPQDVRVSPLTSTPSAL